MRNFTQALIMSLILLGTASTSQAKGLIGLGSGSSQGHGILIGMTAWEDQTRLYFKSINVYLTFAPPYSNSNFSIFSIGASSSTSIFSWEMLTVEGGIGIAYNLFSYHDVEPTAQCTMEDLGSIACEFDAERPQAGGSNLNFGVFGGIRLDISKSKRLFFGAAVGGTLRTPYAEGEEPYTKLHISPSISYWMNFSDD